MALRSLAKTAFRNAGRADQGSDRVGVTAGSVPNEAEMHQDARLMRRDKRTCSRSAIRMVGGRTLIMPAAVGSNPIAVPGDGTFKSVQIVIPAKISRSARVKCLLEFQNASILSQISMPKNPLIGQKSVCPVYLSQR
jgi:hypothetical protein